MNPRLASLIVLLASGCGVLFPDDDDAATTTTGDPTATTGDTGPSIDPDPDSAPPKPVRGTRDRGQFTYHCAGDRDPACLGPNQGPFPAAIAVGGQFLLAYDADDDTSRTPYPASQDRISASGVYQALVPGDTAVFVYDQKTGGEQTLRDFTTLHAATPTSVVLERNDMSLAALFLSVDDEATITAYTRDDDAHDLAGTLTFAWSLAPEGPAVITSFKEGGARIRALAPGEATLTATLGTLTASVPITVLPGDDPTGEPDTTDTTSATTGALQ